MKIASVLTAAFLASFGGTAVAQTDFTALSLEQLLNVEIVSASRFAQKASEAPSAVTVIQRDDIRQYGWRNLAEVLNSVRGFQTSYDRYFRFAGVRGFLPPGDYNSRLLLLLDGMRVNDNIFDQATLGDEFPLDLDLIERIEIVRGPSSTVYGGNAFFGVINVITRSGKDFGGAEVAASAGSARTYAGRVTYGKTLDNGLDFVLSYSGLDSAGQNLFFPEFDNPATNNGWTNGTDKDRNGKFFGKLGLGGFQLVTALSRRTKGIPTGAFGTVFDDPRGKITDEYGLVDATYSRTVAEGIEFTGRGFYGRYDYSGDFVVDNPPVAVNQDRASGRWWGAEARFVASRWRGHHAVLGLEYQRNARQDQTNADADPGTHCFATGSTGPCLESRTQGDRVGLYAQDDIDLRDKLKLSAGARYDHSSLGYDNLSPRLGLIYRPWNEAVLKLLYGSAYRPANAYQLYYTFPGNAPQVGNPALKPESIRTAEIAWEQYVGAKTRLLAGAYVYAIKNWIVQVTTPTGELQFENQPSVQGKGVELEVEHHLAGGAQVRASLAAQFVPDRPNGVLNSAPVHLLKANYSTPLFGSRNWNTGVEAQYVDRRATVTGWTGGYALANASLRWLPQGRSDGSELSLSMYNLFNKRYYEVFPDASLASGVLRETLAQDGRTWQLKYLYRF
jgi:outer membrane receptor protein involved in Fe transport